MQTTNAEIITVGDRFMFDKNALNFILCFAVIVAAFASAFSQTQDSLDIPTLLSEVKEKSDDNWRRASAEYPNYTYKWRKTWRKADKKGKIEVHSELYELFSPTKCPIKKCRRVNVLLAKDGKSLAAEKIEKQRAEAGKKLERIEADAQAQPLSPNPKVPLYWMTFGYWINRPFSSEQELIVWIDGREILEKCEFFAPAREVINGRETIGLGFRPRAGVAFGETTKYMSQAEGEIWIDAADRVLIQLAIWQKGTKFAETTSSYLLEHAALVRDMTLTKEGIWLPRLGRVNGLDYPNLFAEMRSDFSIENFDYHRFKTEVKAVEISNPVEKK